MSCRTFISSSNLISSIVLLFINLNSKLLPFVLSLFLVILSLLVGLGFVVFEPSTTSPAYSRSANHFHEEVNTIVNYSIRTTIRFNNDVEMMRIRILPLQILVVGISYVRSFPIQPPPNVRLSLRSSSPSSFAAAAAAGYEDTLGTSELIDLARSHLDRNETDKANDVLMQAVAASQGAISGTPGLLSCFRELFEKRILLLEDDDPSSAAVERIGLASLCCDQGRYADAVRQLKTVMIDNDPTQLLSKPLQEKAAAMLFRTKSAICDWEDYELASTALVESVATAIATDSIPAVHPFESLMIPCLSLETSTSIAKIYAKRAVAGVTQLQRAASPSYRHLESHSKQPIKLGYISPDFTGKHPLAFLLQDMFRFHNKRDFQIYVYSLFEESDGSPEVQKIVDSADKWTVFPSGMSTRNAAEMIRNDGVDILVDLCGYTGTAVAAEIMAQRPAPLQIAYMGFPASSGAPFIDFMICDETVVPKCYRRHYTESLIFMPHSYFVNSHMFLPAVTGHTRNLVTRSDYGLPQDGFVFCCHSRPDKIDPVTFSRWVRAIKMIREDGWQNGNRRQAEACLWLLRSDPEMERNVRAAAGADGNDDDCGLLVLADKARRDEHLQRLQLADLFLDTPSYGAHTVGCDCLSAGVPLLTLLRREDDEIDTTRNTEDIGRESILTEKLASRVGASLVKALGEESGVDQDLIVSTMEEYESVMAQAARDEMWFSSVRTRVSRACSTSNPLFDTQRWVENLEQALQEVWGHHLKGEATYDVFVEDR